MKTNLIIIVLTIFSFYNVKADIIRAGHSGSGDGSDPCCNAKSVLGATCKICEGDCQDGNIKCTGGLISATCECYDDPIDFGISNLPASLNQAEIDYLSDYQEFLNQIGESQLATFADNVIIAVQSQDQSAYINAESEYVDEFDQLDLNTQMTINDWIEQNSNY